MESAPILAFGVVALHLGTLALLCLFGLHRLTLVALRARASTQREAPREAFAKPPVVTVQIPLYNEAPVARRILRAVAALDYPADRLEIQVLDDSTDETRRIVEEEVTRLSAGGVWIECLHRSDRAGFKAGALAAGLEKAHGEFVAVFDADFVPGPDVLARALPPLADPEVAMVQMRWGHLNRDANRLTEVQAIRLDAHFEIEQIARSQFGLCFNFNGTAGIWRVAAIQDAGGWRADTLTEDLDLSYRAHLRGWRFVFLPDPVCPGELPTDLVALESQQHRWSKGATQVLLRLGPRIWRSPRPLRQRVEALFHLGGNLAYLLMMIDTLFFLVPSLAVRHAYGWREAFLADGPMLLLALGGQVTFFMAGQRFGGRPLSRSLRQVPTLLTTGIGLAINDAKAVLEALVGHESEFVRTPKRGDASPDPTTDLATKSGRRRRPPLRWIAEMTIGLAYAGATVWAGSVGLWAATPFLGMLHVGFVGHGLRRIRAVNAA